MDIKEEKTLDCLVNEYLKENECYKEKMENKKKEEIEMDYPTLEYQITRYFQFKPGMKLIISSNQREDFNVIIEQASKKKKGYIGECGQTVLSLKTEFGKMIVEIYGKESDPCNLDLTVIKYPENGDFADDESLYIWTCNLDEDQEQIVISKGLDNQINLN